VIRLIVTVAAKAEIHDAVVEQQRCSLILAQRVERQLAACRADTIAGDGSLNYDRTAELLRADWISIACKRCT
jgi:hypothetical protein